MNKNKKGNTSTSFRLKRHMSIGSMDAYEDEKYLKECFIDTGDLARLLDTNDSKCIVVGRTGSGKSALLEKIRTSEENIITLLPEELALNYIANSNVIRFFESLGIKLDLFYQLLWRHVLAVELIKKKYKITNDATQKTFTDSIADIFNKDRSKEEAIKYLIEWGDHFWHETDKRIMEMTTKLEEELSASSDLSGLGIPLTAAGSKRLSSEVKAEVIHRAQNVVNNVQIQKLNRVITLLADDIFTDPQQKYYILIDRLDDNWVDDNLRYRMIRALIETSKTLKKIKPVKAIVSLRTDLIYSVFEKTRDTGFQEEKYEDQILKIHWTASDLHELIDKRISLMFREQYTGATVHFSSVFTSRPSGNKAIEYILDRTFMRPRDAIAFVNLCIENAQDKSEIGTREIKEAEKIYSSKRLDALCHEWFSIYPGLELYVNVLKGKTNGFTRSNIGDDAINDLALSLSVESNYDHDPLKKIAHRMFEGEKGPSPAAFRNALLKILYSLGIIGVKKASYEAVSWSQPHSSEVSDSEIKNTSQLEVHPMLFRALGVKEKSNRD